MPQPKPKFPRAGFGAFLTALAGLMLLAIAGCRTPYAGFERPTLASPSRTPVKTATAVFTASPTLPPASPTPVFTPTLTPTSTSAPPVVPALRAQVLQRANCRYGPGAPYLYKYGLVAGSNMEAIGRNDAGSWLLIRAIGGDNPCWVKATLMDVQGEINSLALVETKLPQSPYYAPPKGASAVRTGDEVAVYWSKLHLRPGDDSGQYLYLIEAWLCVDGQLVFTPVGVYETSVILVDERGCAEPSHARLFGVEKHGYTRPVEVPWPTPVKQPRSKNIP